eukprot:CAMPEP_0113864270 /NCGR_PEP_ID=MMETSP0372-20130328/17140_1 /TAXON_ID=340204 /ORGANISM="Lankesteria abbotti" /LENGTH=242 /DNA_ID=CAMNT_0000847247 /DNA_START=182 /DNA_END=910 /DNA_ORIENTATION=+ /assembly_acc=CAM_ASM_000359
MTPSVFDGDEDVDCRSDGEDLVGGKHNEDDNHEDDNHTHKEDDNHTHNEDDNHTHKEDDNHTHNEDDNHTHNEDDNHTHKEDDNHKHKEDDNHTHNEDDNHKHNEDDNQTHKEDDNQTHNEDDNHTHNEDDNHKHNDKKVNVVVSVMERTARQKSKRRRKHCTSHEEAWRSIVQRLQHCQHVIVTPQEAYIPLPPNLTLPDIVVWRADAVVLEAVERQLGRVPRGLLGVTNFNRRSGERQSC